MMQVKRQRVLPSGGGSVKTVPHIPHKNGSKKLRFGHVRDIRNLLIDAGYTLDLLGKSNKLTSPLNLKRKHEDVFRAIHDKTFKGEMGQVMGLIRKLDPNAVLDETRSGSRIGFLLHKRNKLGLVGKDFLSLGD